MINYPPIVIFVMPLSHWIKTFRKRVQLVFILEANSVVVKRFLLAPTLVGSNGNITLVHLLNYISLRVEAVAWFGSLQFHIFSIWHLKIPYNEHYKDFFMCRFPATVCFCVIAVVPV